jgi:hypothetical protein
LAGWPEDGVGEEDVLVMEKGREAFDIGEITGTGSD